MNKYALLDIKTPRGYTEGSDDSLTTDGLGNLNVNIAQGSFAVSSAATYNSSTQNFSGGSSNALQSDAHGSLLVTQRDASGAVQGALANPMRTDPTGTTTQPVSIAATVTTSSVPAASGGLTASKLISAASTNATSVKASAGQLYNVQAFNTNAAARFLKIYNKASAPTVGTDTPVAVYLLPGASAGAGCVIEISNGLALGSGLAFAITTGIADSDTGAVGANEVVVNLQYK